MKTRKSMKIVKDIPEELSNYLEALCYETGARKDLLAFMVERGMQKQEAFLEYQKEFVECYSRYEIAKTELASEYVTPEFPGAKWNLDFATHELTIEVAR